MKHIADRGYTDVALNKHIDKDAVLEEEYEKAGVELTEERKRYLVDERKLYKEVEEEEATPVVEDNNEQDKAEETTPVAEDNNEEDKVEEATPVVEDNNEEDKAEEATPVAEDNNEEDKAEEVTPKEEGTTKKNTNKSGTKNTKKNDQK